MDKRAIGSPQETENLLKIYSYYRVGLGAILTLMYAFGVAREVLGVTGGLLFLITSVSYLTLAVILHLALRHRDDSPNQAQMFTLFLVDLIAIGLLTYSSGGVNSGLGYLSLITIASASIVLSAQLAYLLAALTTIYFLLKTSLQAYSQSYSIQDVFSAGVLGILLFTAATLFLYLSRRIRVTQTEAALRGAEAAELQTLNENIIRGMRTGIVVVDQAKKIKLINSAAIQLLGGTKTQPLL
ncbi:MAG: sensor histidine kinase, partial [bacterium]